MNQRDDLRHAKSSGSAHIPGKPGNRANLWSRSFSGRGNGSKLSAWNGNSGNMNANSNLTNARAVAPAFNGPLSPTGFQG